MKLVELEESLDNLLQETGKRPVVVFAALWPFMRTLDMERKVIPQTILDLLSNLVGRNRDLIMPTFTKGYRQGLCDLDNEQSTTGLLSDMFRKQKGVRRNLSAFFSYAILGPSAEEFAALMPEHAWGDGSTYDWMERHDANFLMIGTHPTHCSYLHRMEWLAKDVVNYRYVKQFSGRIIRESRTFEVSENLFVRSLDPTMINDFTAIYPDLQKHGMKVVRVDDIHIAGMSAVSMKNAYLPLLLKDPYITVKNRQDFEKNDTKCIGTGGARAGYESSGRN